MESSLDHSGLVSYLQFRLVEAAGDAAESHKAAMNSYGAGYDAGVVATIREMLSEIGVDPT